MFQAESGWRITKRASVLRKEALCFRCASAQDAESKRNSEKCEDAIPVLKEISGGRVLFAVADGLGGYAQGFDDRSGGQIASETAMKAALDYFEHVDPDRLPDAEALTNSIFKRLRHLAETRLPPSRLRGALGRHKLATTLALAILESVTPGSETKLQYYWIGDSRIYFLDSEGLHQLTRDDSATGADAFNSIFESAPMSQFLAASMEREWRIHVRELLLDRPGVLIACTDGCYAEWRSPWAFEAALQQALDESDSWENWLECYKARLEPMLSDDASLVAFPLGLSDIGAFKELRSRENRVLGRSLEAERKKRVPPEEIWSSIYQEVYERTPGIEVPRACETTIQFPSDNNRKEAEEFDLAKANLVEAETIKKPRQCRISRLRASGSMLGLAWLFGFVCGAPLGGKILAWLEFFWRWFKSLWQST